MKCKSIWLAVLAVLAVMPISANSKEQLDFNGFNELAHKLYTHANATQAEDVKKTILDIARVAEKAQNSSKFSDEEVKKAYKKINKALTLIKASRHSSDSSELEECLSVIRSLRCHLAKCCKTVIKKLDELADSVKEISQRNQCTIIDTVPFVCEASGKYCVTENLVYDGEGAAITVIASNVTINFQNNSLMILQDGATGILAEDVEELFIENDKITTPNVALNILSTAIHLVNVDTAVIQNVFTENTFRGVLMDQSTNVLFKHCRFKDHIGGTPDFFSSAVRISSSSSVALEDCTFSGSAENHYSIHLLVRDFSKDCRVTRCNFIDSDAGIRIFSTDAILIEDCNMNAVTDAYFLFLQASTFSELTVKNSTFKIVGEDPFFEGIFIDNGSGVILENLIIDIQQPIVEDPFQPAALALFNCNGCQVKECIIPGQSGRGIVVSDSENILIDHSIVNAHTNVLWGLFTKNMKIKDCSFAGAPRYNVLDFLSCESVDVDSSNIDGGGTGIALQFSEGSDCVVQNSKIENSHFWGVDIINATNTKVLNNIITNCGSHGVWALSRTKDTEIRGNTISHNVTSGITSNVDGTSVIDNIVSHNDGDGIIFTSNSTEGYVAHNQVFNNTGKGINIDPSAQVTTFYNTSCDNGDTNCVSVSPSQNMGDAPVVGGNLCCQQV